MPPPSVIISIFSPLCLSWPLSADGPAMEGDSSLDLTHLTEEEQSAILQVLQRDLDLQLVDEGRVRSEVTADVLLQHLCGLWSASELAEPTVV